MVQLLANGTLDTSLIEFATYSAPNTPNPLPVTASPVGGLLQYDYQRDKSALTELTFVVEWSDSLVSSDWHTEGVSESILSDNGRVQQVRATMPKGDGQRRFVRLPNAP